jgi:hypothetical protein
LAIASAAIYSPSSAEADLIGMILGPSGNFFGTIDPGTGAVTPLGTARFDVGKYATTYDAVRNIFYVSDQPTNNNTFTRVIRAIDGTTGAETVITLPGVGSSSDLLAGLEVRSTSTSRVPEPPTAALLILGLAGVAFYARRQGRGNWTHQPPSASRSRAAV